jgi:hypothetical protein
MGTSDRLSAYDDAHRSDAAECGQPLPRLREDVVLAQPEAGIVYTAGPSRLRYIAPGQEVPTALRTGADVLDLFDSFSLGGDDSTSVVLTVSHGHGQAKDRSALPAVASHATLAELVAVLGAHPPILDAAGYDRIDTTIRQIRTLTQIDERRRVLPVLTEALTAAYWMPAGLDETSIADWLTAFDAPSNARGLLRLLDAVNDRPGGRGTVPTWFTSLTDAEARVFTVAKYRSHSADNDAFLAAETHSQIRGVLHASDPGVRDRAILAGVLHPLRDIESTSQHTSHGATLYRALADDDFDLKEGRKISLIADRRPRTGADAYVSRIETNEAGDVLVYLEGADARDKHVRRLLGRDCLAMQTPFTGSLRAAGAPRWKREPGTSRRAVPADVRAAGSA